MRVPAKFKQTQRTRVSHSRTFPAPVGGWNTRDSLAAMEPKYAVVMENWFPKTSYLEIRGGSSSHATGMTGNGKTLAIYNALSGTNKMFCATNVGVYEVTSAGAVGASVATPTNGKYQWVNFGDGTNNYLIMVNGIDKPLYYNGTNWVAVDGATSPALTGLTTTDITGVAVSKGRLFFIQKSSLSFWYLAAGAAGGALSEFDLSAFASKGGYLIAVDTWTFDSGSGPEDRTVFVTSEGEIIVYAGINPSSAADWVLVGVFHVGRPLGKRCLRKFGGDLLILTEGGVFPMSSAVQTADINYRLALSYNIENSFIEAGRLYGANFGWCSYFYPEQSALIVNVPKAEDGEHEQYVMNTITKAWCKFTEWDAEDFAVFNGELYFVDGTVVYKAWTGLSDSNTNIVAYAKQAFSYFGDPGSQKRFVMFRPVIAVNGSISFLTDVDVDFRDTPIQGTATYTSTALAVWDSAIWDTSAWGDGLSIVRQWTSPDAYVGNAASGKLKISTNNRQVQWMVSDFIYETGYPF